MAIKRKLSETHPHLAEEFDLERNAPLTPKTVTFGSVKKIHWRCSSCSNEWVSTPNNRTANGRGCPSCAGQVVHSDGRNSLRRTHPDLAAEFDMERNAPITPDTVIAGTHKVLHWICSECSYKWPTRGGTRTGFHGSGCPACANKVIHKDGRNSLRSTHPHLAAEFDMERNAPLIPYSVLPGSNQKLYWICGECSHCWKTSVNHRTSSRTGCPACAGQAIHSDGRNSMRSTHPDIAAEFDMERNAPITPDTVTAGTNKDLHWICSECSHEWAATGHNRVGRNETGCPACANKVIHKDGRNSMRSTHPHLAAEFDMERNAPLTPDTVVAGTNQKLHWNCPDCSYDWTAVSNSRSSGGRGCPHCAVSGFNSLLPADYYVLEIFEKGWPILYKGGITNNEGNRREKELARRFNKHLDSKHWNLVLVEKMHFASGIDAEKLERRLLGAGEIRAPSIENLSTELFLEHPLDYARKRGWV